MDKKEDLHELLQKISESIEKGRLEYKRKSEEYWNSLTKEQQEMLFYVITSKLYNAEIVDKRSYRGVLYSEFGFDHSMYLVGMWSNFFDLHQHIKPPTD